MRRARIAITAGLLALSACAPTRWRVPEGYRSESIPFPLEFAPTLAHRGVEEIRFAPGFFDPRAPGYFTYAFVWRIEDAPSWDALGGELTAYFRGLMSSVAESKKRAVDVSAYGARLAPVTADEASGAVDVSDGFGDGRALHLFVHARRARCDRGWLHVFTLSPREAAVAEGELARLAREATCATWP